jgi:hypothetical protein
LDSHSIYRLVARADDVEVLGPRLVGLVEYE